MLLNSEQKQRILRRYLGSYTVEEESYGTVRDYCDSCDYLSLLSHLQGDLKDFQRPWTVKALLGVCQPGSRLLEIGAGEPLVAQLMSEFGYDVTVFDPYDGSGHGPTDYESYRERYPNVTIRRELFSAHIANISERTFDAIYSISVIEHIAEPELLGVFEGIRRFIKPGGVSLHSIDHVVAGPGAEYHDRHLAFTIAQQAHLARDKASDLLVRHTRTLSLLSTDHECYYLSAS